MANLESFFTFTDAKVETLVVEALRSQDELSLDIDPIRGTYTSDGDKTVFVKNKLREDVFYVFTISNQECNDAVEFKKIVFKSKYDDMYSTGPRRYQDLMYYNECMYLFGINHISRITAYTSLFMDENISETFVECIVYDLKNLTWHVESQSGAIPHKDMTRIPEKHLFVSHFNYAIFLASTGSKEMDNYAIDAFIIDTNKDTTQWWCKQIRFNANDIKELKRNGNKGHNDVIPKNAICTVVNHHYLFFMRRAYRDIFVVNINDILQSQSVKILKWIKIHTIPETINYNWVLSQRLYFISKGCNILLCCSQDITTAIYQFRIQNKESSIISLKSRFIESGGIEDLKVIGIDRDMNNYNVRYWSNSNIMYKYGGALERYCLISVGNKVLGFNYSNVRYKQIKVYISGVWQEEIRPRYFISQKIGSGGTSQVYLGTKVRDKREIVIKQMDDTQSDMITDSNHARIEQIIYSKLKYNNLSSISCDLYECVYENKRAYLVLEKLGLSLQHLINENSKYNDNKNITGIMSLSQVLGIIDRMIIILYKLHSIGYVHNDIKPENILIGNNENDVRSNKIYLIDFGIATPFWSFKNNKHLSIKTSVPFNGTFRFSSRNHHCKGFSTSRRDDLESLIYLAICLLTGKLPWVVKNDIQAEDAESKPTSTKQKLLIKTKELKQNATLHELCKNVPAPFEMALIYVGSLKFNEKPNYSYLQQLFRDLMKTELPTQLITVNELSEVANDNTNKNKNVKSNILMIATIDFDTYTNFIGCCLPVATIRAKSSMSDEKSAKHEKEEDDHISAAVTDIAVKQLDKMETNGTITNHPTHMSVCGMRNRFGYLIESLTIDKGVPNKLPCDTRYAGIIVYEGKSRSALLKTSQIIGKIYMLSSSECEQINKQYTKKTGRNLGGIVHGAIYYHYFKDTIFKASKKSHHGKNKLSFIRGFSIGSNGQLKCRSGVFNFIGYKLIDEKYKPLPTCEENFIDCALKRYWNDNTLTKTTFEQFIRWDQYITVTNDSTSVENHDAEQTVDSTINSMENIYDVKDNLDQMVPGYEDGDIDCNPLSLYSSVELLWQTNIVPIIDCLCDDDKLNLRYVSKQGRLLMNRYCLWKSKFNHPWYYICDVSISGGETMLKISTQLHKDAGVDLSTMHCSNSQIDYNSNGGKFLLPNYHPLWHILRDKDKFKHSLHRIEYDQNLKYLILLKCFGIFDFISYTKFEKQTSSLSIISNGNKYTLQPRWSWERNGKWMEYDNETCLQIENSYRDGDISIILSKGVYRRGQYKKLYKILFNCKHSKLNASNQSRVDDIYNDKKWKSNMFCKYFYQQNVQNKWVRIVRRKIKVDHESKNCVIM